MSDMKKYESKIEVVATEPVNIPRKSVMKS